MKKSCEKVEKEREKNHRKKVDKIEEKIEKKVEKRLNQVENSWRKNQNQLKFFLQKNQKCGFRGQLGLRFDTNVCRACNRSYVKIFFWDLRPEKRHATWSEQVREKFVTFFCKKIKNADFAAN